MNQQDIECILNTAINSPSGDNSQPWKFTVKGNVISLWNVPGADATPYNFRERGSFIGHGAVIENIILLAPGFGYETSVSLFSNQGIPDHVADIILTQLSTHEEPLAAFIPGRVTNRKAYDAKPITSEQRQQIIESSRLSSGCEFRITEDREHIQSLAKTISLNERLILENREIHDKLFATIRWTAEEEREHLHGMYIKTLELALPQEKAFKFFRKWKALSILSKIIPIPKLVSNDSRKLYATASAFGLIVIPSDSNADFIVAGRMLQRIWLTVTKLGLSLQPTAALLYLAQRIKAGEEEMFTEKQRSDIMNADGEIRKTFGINHGVSAMLFRIGYASAPTARSLKRPPQISFED